MDPPPAPPEPSSKPDSTSLPAWECPKCGGSEIKKFSLLYEEHRSTSTSKTTAVGLGLGAGGLGVGVGGASSRGISMTDLARRVSPPAFVPQRLDGTVTAFITLLGMAAVFLAYLVWGFLGAGLASPVALFVGVFVAAMLSPSEPDPRYRAASRRWNQSYLCLRCGGTVIADDQGELQVIPRKESDPEIDRLLREGKLIHAIKVTRETTGLGLKEAKEHAEARARELGV